MDYNFEQLVETFTYLDRLRETGLVNMFGASSYVAQDLDYSKADARELVALWMKSYDGETSVEDRALSFENA